MRKIIIALSICALIIPAIINQTAGEQSTHRKLNASGTPKEDFIEGLKKVLEASYYTENYLDAFKSIQTGKAKVNKKYQQTSYDCLVQLPDKEGIVYYAESSSYAAASFSKDWKDETTCQIDFSVTENWIREALGTDYTDDKKIFDASASVKTVDVYFYSPGVTPNEKKNNWKVRLSSIITSNSYSVSIQVVGTKK